MATVAFLIALALVASLPVLILAAWWSHELAIFYERTSLVAELVGPTIPDQQRQFAERVASRFPIGMSADELERTLSAQGFTPSQPVGRYENRLHVERALFPCLIGWDVYWTARDGAVSAASGTMTATCL